MSAVYFRIYIESIIIILDHIVDIQACATFVTKTYVETSIHSKHYTKLSSIESHSNFIYHMIMFCSFAPTTVIVDSVKLQR